MPDPLNLAYSVDALSPRLTGIGRYCLELARGLPRARGVERVSYFRGNDWFDAPEDLLRDGQQPQGRGLRHRLRNWRGRRGARGALVHGPNYFLPHWAESGIVTVHDLSVLLYPETHPVERVRDFERRFKHSLDRARAILTDSETVRQEVIATLGFRPEQVFAVPLGISPGSDDRADTAGILAQLGLQPQAYVLSVCTFEPRKRLDGLLGAYQLLDDDLRRAFPLVLVGASGWRNEALHAAIEAAQAAGWLKRLDYVPDATRDALYRGARLFVYPSRYEGFGLPPLEAMQHGVPTMISDAACLIEVTKGAARISAVDDRTAFAANLAEALEDDTWRREAAAAGREVAASYTWPACVERTVAVYHRVAGQ